jgi:WD40 repeat protein
VLLTRTSLVFNPGGDLLATGRSSTSVDVWSLTTQEGKLCFPERPECPDKIEKRTFRNPKGFEGTLHALAFSPDDHLLLGVNNDRDLTMWDVATGAVLSEVRVSNFTGDLIFLSNTALFVPAGVGDKGGSLSIFQIE